jgi:EPS-associated MarR family transcriptional regulator
LTEEANYKLLKLLEQNPQASQRALAAELGVSLGKVNYCLQALIGKGHVKARNFGNANNKNRYLYILTPAGIRTKAEISVRYLKRKMEEYDTLKLEIEELKTEVQANAQHTPAERHG